MRIMWEVHTIVPPSMATRVSIADSLLVSHYQSLRPNVRLLLKVNHKSCEWQMEMSIPGSIS